MQSRYKSTRSVIALLLVAVMIIGFSATLYKIQVQDHEILRRPKQYGQDLQGRH